jgi:hypothetical protein
MPLATNETQTFIIAETPAYGVSILFILFSLAAGHSSSAFWSQNIWPIPVKTSYRIMSPHTYLRATLGRAQLTGVRLTCVSYL